MLWMPYSQACSKLTNFNADRGCRWSSGAFEGYLQSEQLRINGIPSLPQA